MILGAPLEASLDFACAIEAAVRRSEWRPEAALERLDRIASQSPRKESFLFERGEILERAGRLPEACASYQGALDAMEALPPAKQRTRAVERLRMGLGRWVDMHVSRGKLRERPALVPGLRDLPIGDTPVTIDQFRKMLMAQPFLPFTLHLADGRQMHVPHRELASMSPSGRTVIVSQPDDTFEVIDLLLVVGLEAHPAAGSATPAP